ncbi:hypothetical protein PoB_001248400 [Plakobranchus ocellatus]|uniref:Uncharacterized protein n=1 Tax=Plakobranchus ocellatus TaxID=259542 RepID=A0AAV3YSE6_9GAST|nr:hypothetical protein PoB_001248400 [Plakobranchus ocellatus]
MACRKQGHLRLSVIDQAAHGARTYAGGSLQSEDGLAHHCATNAKRPLINLQSFVFTKTTSTPRSSISQVIKSKAEQWQIMFPSDSRPYKSKAIYHLLIPTSVLISDNKTGVPAPPSPAMHSLDSE